MPQHPLGMRVEDKRLRLSLAGVQRKAVLVRDGSGRFGKPLDGMPSSHILKPELPDSEYPGLASQRVLLHALAARCGLSSAAVELVTLAGRPCLVVERFDREQVNHAERRVHQEDLCQALGLTPDFKYQKDGWRLPSYARSRTCWRVNSPRFLAETARRGAQAAVFHFLVGNADAHAEEHLAAACPRRRAAGAAI